MPFTLQLTAASVPPPACFPANLNELLQITAAQLQVMGLETLSTINFGPATPPTNMQGSPWFKTDSQYVPIGWYAFSGGQWVPIPSVLLPGMIFDFFRGLNEIVPPYYLCNGQTIVGSVGGTLNTPNLQGMFIIGAGVSPVSGTNFGFGLGGGTETVTLTTAQIPSHVHGPNGSAQTFINAEPGGSGVLNSGSGVAQESTTGSTGGGGSHPNLPPYFTLYKIIYWP